MRKYLIVLLGFAAMALSGCHSRLADRLQGIDHEEAETPLTGKPICQNGYQNPLGGCLADFFHQPLEEGN